MSRLLPFVPALLIGVCASTRGADHCPPRNEDRVTDDYYFTASSDQGATGDIVAVDLSLTVEQVHGRPHALIVVGCYDDTTAELVGEPRYSDVHDRLFWWSVFFPLGEEPGPQRPGGGRGFLLAGNMHSDMAQTVLAAGQPVPLATLFPRLRGEAGSSCAITFCDYEFQDRHGPCERNLVLYQDEGNLKAVSTRHVPGELRVIEGEPTRTEPPDLPPNARVYPEAPTPEEAEILFELTGGNAHPGARGVPLELYLTSSYEFSGFSVAITFPLRYLEFARVEEHTRPGTFSADHEMGTFGLVMANSRRRAGAEGERVHAATLYFNVKDAAREVSQVSPEFGNTPFFTNWLAIHHEGGVAGELPVTAQVTPLRMGSRALEIQSRATTLGDVDLDYHVTMSDAVSLVGTLSRGEASVVCAAAADANEDGRVNLSDAVAILNHLFRGRPLRSEADIFCGAGAFR